MKIKCKLQRITSGVYTCKNVIATYFFEIEKN